MEGSALDGDYFIDSLGPSSSAKLTLTIHGPGGQFDVIFTRHMDGAVAYTSTKHCDIIFVGETQTPTTPSGLATALDHLAHTATPNDEICSSLAVQNEPLLPISRLSQFHNWKIHLALAATLCAILGILASICRNDWLQIDKRVKVTLFYGSVGCMTLLGGWARLEGLDSTFCESASTQRVLFGASPLWQLISMEIFDYRHPPATSILLHCVLWLGREEWLLRLPFALASTCGLLAIGLLARKIVGSATAVLTCALCALLIPHVQHGSEIGSHALWPLVAPVTLLLLIRIRTTPSVRSAAALTLAIGLAAWTHFATPFLIVAIGLELGIAIHRWIITTCARRYLVGWKCALYSSVLGDAFAARRTGFRAPRDVVLLFRALLLGLLLGSPPLLYFFVGMRIDVGFRAAASAAPDALWGAAPLLDILKEASAVAGPHVALLLLSFACLGTVLVTMRRNAIGRGSEMAWLVFLAWAIPLAVLFSSLVLRMRGLYIYLATPFFTMLAATGAVYGPKILVAFVRSGVSSMAWARAARGLSTTSACFLLFVTAIWSVDRGLPELSKQKSACQSDQIARAISPTSVTDIALVHGYNQSLLGHYLSDTPLSHREVEIAPSEWSHSAFTIHALCDVADLYSDWHAAAENRFSGLLAEHDQMWLIDWKYVEPSWPSLERRGNCELRATFPQARVLLCGRHDDPTSRTRGTDGTGTLSVDTTAHQALISLGYIDSHALPPGSESQGVERHESSHARPGYNMVGCTLLDMNGKRIATWADGYYCALASEGTVLQFQKNDTVRKLNFDGSVIWEKRVGVHHEITGVKGDHTLFASKEVHSYHGRQVMFDLVIELDETGVEVSRWSTWENFAALREHHPAQQLDREEAVTIPAVKDGRGNPSPFGGDHDYYHLNGIQVLPSNALGLQDPRFRKGNWLLSFGFVNLLVILDRDTKEIVWSWGPDQISGVHTARMTDSGTIVLFDNGHERTRPWSRVLEIDPVSREIVWEYAGTAQSRFYSLSMGSAQRLAGGNTLIGDSLSGYAFEITTTGDLVWAWRNPMFDPATLSGAFYRIERYDVSQISLPLSDSLPR